SEGRGIGDRFLGHVERCSVLLHLVDGTSENVAADCETVLAELEAYGGALAEKPRVTVLNKIDALEPEARAAARAALQAATGAPVLEMSGVSGEGVEQVLRALRAEVDAARAPAEPEEDMPWTP
ncbi:MAG: GTPase ObgE, partial [Pseudomonadota bacterium]